MLFRSVTIRAGKVGPIMRNDFSALTDDNISATGASSFLPGETRFDLSFLDIERVKHDPQYPFRNEVECLLILCELYGEPESRDQRVLQVKQIKEIVDSIDVSILSV